VITAAVCTTFKRDVLALAGEVKIALYTAAASLSKATTAYSPAHEVVGAGYTPGGLVLTGLLTAIEGDSAGLIWSDPIWPTATITARGALVYHASKGNKAVAVLDFGEDVTSTHGRFTVALPAPVVRLT